MEKTPLPHYHGEEPTHADVIRELLEKSDTFTSLANIFKQLGDATRIRIFWLLCHCEECVVNIAAMLDMSSPAVSHHLRTLRSSGLLVTRRAADRHARELFEPFDALRHRAIDLGVGHGTRQNVHRNVQQLSLIHI